MGHHEIDTVVGQQGTPDFLLFNTERVIRFEHIIKLPHKTQKTIKEGIDLLDRFYEENFRTLFKPVACDS